MATFAAHPATCALLGCARPVWPPRDYCGRTHAQEALGAIAPPHGSCHVCRLSGCDAPVAFDVASGRVHDYCGRAHSPEVLERGERDNSLRALQGRGAPRVLLLAARLLRAALRRRRRALATGQRCARCAKYRASCGAVRSFRFYGLRSRGRRSPGGRKMLCVITCLIG